ncbi:MAG: acid phosphatase, partial [Sphingomonas sp.]
MQYLYGSGEAAASSLQAYLLLNDWMAGKAAARQAGQPITSVVLAPGATLAAPRYLPCGEQPLAVVLDVDETSLLNLGYEDTVRDREGFDAARWSAWERTGAGAVAAVPGVLEAKAVARAVGVTFVFNTNRS